MKIKSSGQTHTLYRYGGQVEGKTLEIKVGTVTSGTKPEDVPPDLLENLTPKESRELAEFLRREQVGLARKALARLAADIESVTELIAAETLDEETAQKLAAALSRCKGAVGRVQRSRQPVAVLDIQLPAEPST